MTVEVVRIENAFICEGHLRPAGYEEMYAVYINYFIYCPIKE